MRKLRFKVLLQIGSENGILTFDLADVLSRILHVSC